MNSKYIIGLMSGTSLDGVDLVYAHITFNGTYSFQIIYSETVSYPKKWENTLREAFYYSKDKLQVLNKQYGLYLANLILEFITKNNIEKVDFIASHGHTIHHKPEKGYTLQIGDGQTIANLTKIKTICDFRSQDVALGGQGAPLVPIGDSLLFATYDYCLNLGGFANISFDNALKERIAYDICPVNIVMNHYTNKLGKPYDDRGLIAQSGTINKNLLAKLNALPFYIDEKPKSLGFEFVEETILPLIDSYNLSVKEVLATYIAHVALQISTKIKTKGKVLVTGGGAFNDFLISQLKILCQAEIIVPNKTIIDYKEALIFAFLGFLKDKNKVNCLKSVTGASKDHSSGEIFE
jgi:anhydro-N-acetylmuramic acid kinase